MKLGSNYRVQVSRMMPFLSVRWMDEREKVATSVPDDGAHCLPLLMRNSKHRSIYTHFASSGVDLSLLTPRHRCYALLSSALS
jgi:hypothetical protein